MPIDINQLRRYKGGNPSKWRKYMEARFKPASWVNEVIAKDEEWRHAQNQLDNLRKDVNTLQKNVIAPKKKAKEPCDAEVAQLKEMQSQIDEMKNNVPELAKERNALLIRIGNVVDPQVPISNDEEHDNLVINLYPEPLEATASRGDDDEGEPRPLLPCPLGILRYTLPPTKALTHDDLLWRIDGYEPTRGQNVAGHRAYFLKNAGVLLNQALINYAIAFLSKRNYEILQPSFFMKKDVMSTLAQLDDFDEQLYKISGKTDDPNGSTEKYLIATSEQPLCGYHMGDWIKEQSLPIRYGGISTCFRKELGAHGRDIRGIFRVHQFEKIEQVCITVDDLEQSQKEQENMLKAAEEFYQSLGFPYRVVCIVSGELNDAAVKKYDLEAWFPGQQAYRELVSCSNCTDYQARGVETRCGIKKQGEEARYVHMLNSTLCATGRGICCLLENYQTEDGVIVPEVLQPYMAGIDFLPFKRGPLGPTKGENVPKKNKR